EALEYLKASLEADPDEFALKNAGNKDLPVRALAEQIALRKKAGLKFPKLSARGLIFQKEAFEQSSGEIAAAYKQKLISGRKLIDITGGLGIDLMYLSGNFEETIYCERNDVLCSLFKHNSKLFPSRKMEIIEGDSISALKQFPDSYFDWLYADPARREQGRRSVDLRYCSPNVIEHQELLFSKAKNLLLKISPAFEVPEAVKLFPNLEEFTVVSVDGECKEILLLMKKEKSGEGIKIRAASLHSDNKPADEIEYILGEIIDRNTASEISGYFYEPDAAIIKSRLTAKLARKHNMKFVNDEADYLTSSEYINDFSGRSFYIRDVWEYKPKQITEKLKALGINKANISRRSFPLSPDEIRSKLKLKDGGNAYLFFTRDDEGKLICLYCQK
ncbi:MAG TPA: hypothetical protein VHP30_12450, partial [Ignavibacteriales bacterium]|nr:hypothetical protein [Ignavibacteriales bacterium]